MKNNKYSIRQFQNIKIDAERIMLILDMLFLASLFAHFMILTFNTSMMEQETLYKLLRYTKGALYLLCLIKSTIKCREDRSFLIKAFVFAAVFFVSYRASTYRYIFDYAVIALGLKDVDISDVLKTYLIALIPSVFIVMYLCYRGNIVNIIYTQSYIDRVRVAYGFISPTDFAAHLSFMFAAWIVICREKRKVINILLGICLWAFIHYKVDARTSEIIILGYILILLISLIPKKKMSIRWGKVWKWFKTILCLTPIACMLVMLYLYRLFADLPESEMMKNLDRLLSRRLSFGVKSFQDFDITWFGRYCRMIGNGGLLHSPKDYTFVDCSYFNMLFKYGIIAFALIMIIIITMLYKHRQNDILFFVLILICVASMMEHHLMEYHYNVFMLLPFCYSGTKRKSCFDKTNFIHRATVPDETIGDAHPAEMSESADGARAIISDETTDELHTLIHDVTSNENRDE